MQNKCFELENLVNAPFRGRNVARCIERHTASCVKCIVTAVTLPYSTFATVCGDYYERSGGHVFDTLYMMGIGMTQNEIVHAHTSKIIAMRASAHVKKNCRGTKAPAG